MEIKVWRNPYDNGTNLTNPKEIEINPGLTVIVGCNGAGKTTLIENIKDVLQKENIPFCIFNNLKDGGSMNMSALIGGFKEFASDTIETGISLWTASEGEAIKINLARNSTLYEEFLNTGFFKNKSYEFSKIFNEKEDVCNSNVRVFLYDATDSGLSIDSVIEIKNLFSKILEISSEKGLETYIIITANEYELCRNENCFDVNKGKYITFKDYEDYRSFIIKSRTLKENRLKKEDEISIKKHEKAAEKYKLLKEKTTLKINKIKEKADSEKRELSFSDNHKIKDLEDDLKRFARENNLDI